MDSTHLVTKTVPFRFRGIDFSFALSQGLFSSADIDTGTRFLLKVFSHLLDEDVQAGRPLPRRVLDAGCGVGVIGICAAAAIGAAGGQARVRARDRDALAREITRHNARVNNIPPEFLQSFTEPLLSSGESAGWDLILCNVPAKAGAPVLEDFIARTPKLLNPAGRCALVVVKPLADFFRRRIADSSACLEREESGAEHSVFVYGPGARGAPAANAAGGESGNFSCYRRGVVDCEIETIPLHIETLHGAPDFDWPSGASLAAAKLLCRLGAEKLRAVFAASPADTAPLLVNEGGQGFFPCFALEFLRRECQLEMPPVTVLSGRNIIALEAARVNCNALAHMHKSNLTLIPAIDIGGGDLPQAKGQFAMIASFPDLLPPPAAAFQQAALWKDAALFLRAGGIFIAGFSSTDAERFDRKKPAAFTRMGDIKRKGFRALAYRLQANP